MRPGYARSGQLDLLRTLEFADAPDFRDQADATFFEVPDFFLDFGYSHGVAAEAAASTKRKVADAFGLPAWGDGEDVR